MRGFRAVCAGVTMLGLFLAAALMYGQRMLPPAVPAYLDGLGSDFSLQSANGTVHLHDFRGKVGLLYFGYSHCPDVCPAALGNMAQALQQIPAAHADDVYGLFVSVDPRRDSVAHLQRYTAFFDARIRGLTGTPAQLQALAPAWRMDFEVPEAAADTAYSVRHSNFIYLINGHGRVVALFDETTPAADMAGWMRRWLGRW